MIKTKESSKLGKTNGSMDSYGLFKIEICFSPREQEAFERLRNRASFMQEFTVKGSIHYGTNISKVYGVK